MVVAYLEQLLTVLAYGRGRRFLMIIDRGNLLMN